MRNIHSRKSFHLFAALLLSLQLVSMFFCGDAGCLQAPTSFNKTFDGRSGQGGSDENCDALICVLLAEHATANAAADDGPNDSCQCVCHHLITLPQVTLNAAPLAATPFYSGEALRLVSSPVRSIYHPPLV